MTDKTSALGAGAFGPEPDHDRALGSHLESVVGRIPADRVNWESLAHRIGVVIEAQRPTPWWGYAARWERRAIPLALAAGIAGALTLWSSTMAAQSLSVNDTPEFLSAVVSGAPATDAVRSFARSVTEAADFSSERPQ
ncbi:MAG: hypothetical protein ABJE47_07815 [bacterium]